MSVGAVNKQTGERIPTAGMPAVDSVLSGTSTNPVQNKVVKEAFDGKQDTLTFDDAPTDGSNNPVKSNGIYDSEKDIYAVIGEMGAKNFIPYPYEDTTKTLRGITFTDNGDGTVTLNGQNDNTAACRFFFDENKVNDLINIPVHGGRKYILTTGTTIPNGVEVYVRVYYTQNKLDSESIAVVVANGNSQNELDLTEYPTIYAFRAGILCTKETRPILEDLVIKPMLRLASDTDNTYQPYAKTNKQLTDDVALLESGKANTDMVAADFNAGTSYTAGNYCVQDGNLYKFKNNHSGAWSAADVDEVKITGELSALKSGLIGLETITTLTVTPEANANYELSAYSKGYTKAGIITLFLDITCTTPATGAFVKIGSINGALRTGYGTVICEVNGNSTLTVSVEYNGDIKAIYGEATKQYRNTLTAVI